MRRLLGGSLLVAAVLMLLGVFAGSGRASPPDCDEPAALCTEPVDSIGYEGAYTGHDEPSLLFYSNSAGSGNSTLYHVTLPTDPKVLPNQAGTAGTWNFQLHPAFWLGMALCDNQSGPEFTHAPCAPDSDTNIFDGTDPAAPDYIGRHPGTAFLEVQFYPPGWAPFQLPGGVSCDASQWCAAMAIFSFNQDQNTGVNNNAACLNQVGVEPANFAFVTTSGTPHAPPAPLSATGATFTPNPATDLFMGSGDALTVDIHDAAGGLTVIVHDQTTGKSGSMTASAANGFAQVLYEPVSATCHQSPYTFRPMYSTSSEHTRVPWAAHSYNVAFSDEIGHFEYCDVVAGDGSCASNSEGVDDDDAPCLTAAQSLFVPISGCTGTDNDFDGTSYQQVWPGTDPNRGQDKKYHASPITFTSPLFNGSSNYDRVAFEADLPRIEAADFGGNCDRFTGTNCVNPPPGSNFYPIYSTGSSTQNPSANGHCVWQLGGPFLKGTTNTFGGNSAAEYGPLLFSFYPNPDPAIRLRTNNFRNVLSSNPCPA
jgi:hypothetical protein